ncbi:hypothetical protein JST97_24665 [bacterium]|nr:hypothetical protein [bacterium]
MTCERKRGLALLTGVFVAMVCYFLATVVLAQVSQDFGFTRSDLDSVKARYLAQASLNKGLHLLNQASGPDWERLYTEPNPPFREVTPEGWFELAIRPDIKDVTKIHLLATGQVGGHSQKIQMLVRKKPAVSGLEYAVLTDGPADHRTSTIYSKSEEQLDWSAVSSPPSQFVPGHTREAAPLPAGNTLQFVSPEGDINGKLFVVARLVNLNPTLPPTTDSPDVLWCYTPNEAVPPADRWQRLPQIDDETSRIRDLAIDQDANLYALRGNKDIFKLAVSSHEWTRLPIDAPALQGGSGSLSLTTNQEPYLFNIAADEDGAVFALTAYRAAPDTPLLTRPVAWKDDHWLALNPPTQVEFIKDPRTGKYSRRKIRGVKADTLRHLTVDRRTGQVFAEQAFPGNPAATIYRFTPQEIVPDSPVPLLKGVWNADPLPPPGMIYRSGSGWTREDDWIALAHNTVDQASNLLGVYHSSRFSDTIFQCDLTQKGWRHLHPIAGGSSTSDVSALGGGGKRIPGLTTQYLPITHD